MKSVAVVVLNYLNYQDTMECVWSIFDKNGFHVNVVIVDNGSYNNSFKELKNSFSDCKNVHLIRLKSNVGFARGNNAGISYARRKLKADFVLVINNDTVMIQDSFIEKMVSQYELGTGVLGPSIKLRDGCIQPEIFSYVTWKENILFMIYQILELRKHELMRAIFPEPDRSKRVSLLHGCALLFTPDFFSTYKGFYPFTFLYCEEEIIYLMCKNKGLKEKYVKDCILYHKEDCSSGMSFQNEREKITRYSLSSRKHLILWAVYTQIMDKMAGLMGAKRENRVIKHE